VVFADVFALGFIGQQTLRAVYVKNLLFGYCRNSFFANFEKKGSIYNADFRNSSSERLAMYTGLAAFLCGLADWIVDMMDTDYVDAPPRLRRIS
jgi:hypothetical protein